MNKIRLILLSLLSALLLIVLTSNRNIFVTFTNSSNIENINFLLYYDGEMVHQNNLKQSMFPSDMIDLSGNFGFRKVLLVCEDLQIKEEVKIFSIFNNYVDFEISNDFDLNQLVISRKSWFPLTFE